MSDSGVQKSNDAGAPSRHPSRKSVDRPGGFGERRGRVVVRKGDDKNRMW